MATPEHSAMIACTDSLTTELSGDPKKIADVLLADGLIAPAVRSKVYSESRVERDKASVIVSVVTDKVSNQSSCFHLFVHLLRKQGKWTSTAVMFLTNKYTEITGKDFPPYKEDSPRPIKSQKTSGVARPTTMQTNGSRLTNGTMRHLASVKLTYNDHFDTLHEKARGARTCWLNLGTALKMDPDYLDELKEIHRDDPSKCFRAMLIKWLKAGSNCNLNCFLNALKNDMVGCGYLYQKVKVAIMAICPESADPPIPEDVNPKPLIPSQEETHYGHNGTSQMSIDQPTVHHRVPAIKKVPDSKPVSPSQETHNDQSPTILSKTSKQPKRTGFCSKKKAVLASILVLLLVVITSASLIGYVLWKGDGGQEVPVDTSPHPDQGLCHKIDIKNSTHMKDLRREVGKVGDWLSVCLGLEVKEETRNNLEHETSSADEKVRRCINAFLEQDIEPCWEKVVEMLCKDVHQNVIAKDLATAYGVDYKALCE